MTGRIVQINVSPGVPGEIAAGDPVERLTPAEVARHLAVGRGG